MRPGLLASTCSSSVRESILRCVSSVHYKFELQGDSRCVRALCDSDPDIKFMTYVNMKRKVVNTNTSSL